VAYLAAMASRYEVVGTLAQGGMAEIVLARTEGPQGFARAVVLKRILRHLATRADFRAMFLDEARLMAGIHHSNVVNVHELVEEDDQLMLVMDYLQGESADGLLRASVAEQERLPFAVMAYLVAEACAGLHAAHELTGPDGATLGLVHRDVSPQNIFVNYDGHVQLLDFGIAHAAGRSTQTEAGQIKGKFRYMSPEQCRGKVLDRRSDIFALGIVLYELTTQHGLFHRDSDMQTMRAVCKEAIPAPSTHVPGYPPALEAICLRALDRDRNARFDTAHDLEIALRDYLSKEGVSARAELAAIMARLFDERIDDKAEMLRRLRAGEPSLPVAQAETHVDVPVPSVAFGHSIETTDSTRPDAPAAVATQGSASPRRRLAIVAAGTLALGAAIVGAGLALRSDPAPSAAAPSASVVIEIETTPAGAEVVIDSVRVGVTPAKLPLPARDTPLAVHIGREGYEPVVETIVPNVSQRLRLRLNPIAAPTASASDDTRPGTPPQPRPRAQPAPPNVPAPPPSASARYYQL
jgi:tRNA A-37 threonylcarbamoyl transferase component Bud32